MKILNVLFLNILLFSTDLFSVVEFPFGISFLKKSPRNHVLYGAAHPNYSAQEVIKDSALFQFNGVAAEPITPEKVTINVINVAQPNPLYDQGIRSLAFIAPEQKDLPVVLSTADLRQIYAFESVETGSLLISQILKDSQGDDTSLIQGLSASIDGTIFTVTSPNQGVLGDSGTGIAAVMRGYIDVNNKSERVFTQIALNSAIPTKTSAFPFDLSSPVFVFNNQQAQSFENPILCWDDSLQCLYLGLTVIGSAEIDGGAKGIAVFSIKGGVPTLISLIDDQALFGNDDLLLSKQGSSGSVSINKIEIMHTSTGLSYLIAVVGFGTEKEIRVLPLVDNLGAFHGTVAAKTSTISTLYLSSSRYAFFQKRMFDQPALVPTDLLGKTELPVLVGFDATLSALLYQNMNDCFVQGDSIFITINTPDVPEQSGIYFSRALFDSDGRIVSWTHWQRAQEAVDLFLAVADVKQGGFYTAAGTDSSHLFTVSKSEWKLGIDSSYAFLADLLKKYLLVDGYELSFTKILFEPNRIDNSILFASGSYGKLLVNVLGTINENGIVVKQSVDNPQVTIVTEVTTDLVPDTTTLVFSDPVLQSVGFITDCAYAYRQDPDEEFLVVGGSGGAALLVQADFGGWPSNVGIGNNFSNLIVPVQWIVLEDQEYIKKVVADNQYLYLVSDKLVTRINMNESDFSNQIIDKVIIANINDFENTQAFVDYIPSQSHAVLATTNGLYYTDLNSSVQTDDVFDIIWHIVVLPESVQSIEHIQVVTQSGNPVDMTRNEGSQIIVSATSQSSKQGTIVRATVNQDGIVVCFDDQRIRGARSHFIDYGSFIKSGYSDGAFWYALIKSGALQLRPCLIGSIALQPETPFLGLMPSYISLFNRFERFLPRAILSLPTGTMMITTNKEFAITQ